MNKNINKTKRTGQSLRSREIQEKNTVIGTEAFITEYENRKAQGWRAVCGPDLVCVSMGKIRVKTHSGEFVTYNDDLRKIVWKKSA